MPPLPTPFRAALGLAAKAIEEARRLPDKAIEIPVLAVSTALQMSLRAQQHYAMLAARGEELLNRRKTSDEPPIWATFDDPIPAEQLTTLDDDDDFNWREAIRRTAKAASATPSRGLNSVTRSRRKTAVVPEATTTKPTTTKPTTTKPTTTKPTTTKPTTTKPTTTKPTTAKPTGTTKKPRTKAKPTAGARKAQAHNAVAPEAVARKEAAVANKPPAAGRPKSADTAPVNGVPARRSPRTRSTPKKINTPRVGPISAFDAAGDE